MLSSGRDCELTRRAVAAQHPRQTKVVCSVAPGGAGIFSDAQTQHVNSRTPISASKRFSSSERRNPPYKSL